MLHTGTDLLTDRQNARLDDLFVVDEHVEVEITWALYQQMITTYREPDQTHGKSIMTKLITSLSNGVPDVLGEVATLGRTLKKRADDVLAYFDRPGTSAGPRSGFANLTNYIARSLLETGGFRPRLHPRM